MRRLSQGALIGFIAISAVWFALSLAGPMPFPIFITLFTLDMLLFGLLGSNFNALAMEPLGHVAGTASSVLGFTQTFGGGVIGTIIGQMFDGTVMPLAAGFCGVSIVAFLMVVIAERGKMFQPHNPAV
jgi:DHA1 family bicyclomycin/chloramphenicol resistance-like MFS transporter